MKRAEETATHLRDVLVDANSELAKVSRDYRLLLKRRAPKPIPYDNPNTPTDISATT